MNTSATISNPYANWAAIVDARAARLTKLARIVPRSHPDAYYSYGETGLTGRELKALVARAAFSTWLDARALPAAPDP